MTTTTLSVSPHREPPDSVPLAEYETLRRENEQLRARVNRRDAVKRVGRFLLTVVASVLVVAVVAYCGWFCLFRGTAWGARARQNAEREAVRTIQQHYGQTVPVWCAGDNHCEVWRIRCEGTALFSPSQRVNVVLCCDDDEASANDGCTEPNSTP